MADIEVISLDIAKIIPEFEKFRDSFYASYGILK